MKKRKNQALQEISLDLKPNPNNNKHKKNKIKLHYYQLTFTPINSDISDILIAILSENNFDTFEEQENALLAYISENMFDENEVKEIVAPFNAPFTHQLLLQKNWNEEWEKNYDPVIINDDVAIRASFHKPINTVKHNIIITPKMSFGTGHHATTSLIMNYMTEIDFVNKKVLDNGCGTGILSIYASIKNAKKIDANDVDDWCIENTIENLAINKIENVSTFLGDLHIIPDNKYDIILANINLNILEKNLPILVNRMATNAQIVFSGLLETDVEKFSNQCISLGLKLNSSKNKLQWSALHFTN